MNIVNYDPEKTYDVISQEDIRELLEDSMAGEFDLSRMVPNGVDIETINRFLRYNMRWDRYGCCSYDCGPLAWSKSGYVPLSKVIQKRNAYFEDHPEEFAEALEGRSRAKANNVFSDYATTRNIFAKSLADVYHFAVLYHESPIRESYNFAGFQKHRDEVWELVNKIQEDVNEIIVRERLPLTIFNFMPERK